jgi:hypothetical protein
VTHLCLWTLRVEGNDFHVTQYTVLPFVPPPFEILKILALRPHQNRVRLNLAHNPCLERLQCSRVSSLLRDFQGSDSQTVVKCLLPI